MDWEDLKEDPSAYKNEADKDGDISDDDQPFAQVDFLSIGTKIVQPRLKCYHLEQRMLMN